MCETTTNIDNPFAVVDGKERKRFPLSASGKKSFYCSNGDIKPKREQLSSKEGLWCIDDCAKEQSEFGIG